jgi:hypothetical protein
MALPRGCGFAFPCLSRTKIFPSRCSTDQHSRGLNAGGAQRFAGAQVETGVVPRTAHSIANHEAIHERAMVMRALRAHRKHFRAATHEQHFLVSDVAGELAPFGKLRGRDARLRIGATGLTLILCHCHSL